MKSFSAPDIRNVAVVGHNTVGKTTLVASLLYAAGATTRAGRIEDGTCPTDFDGEEIDRKISINLACAHVLHRDTKINFIDAPGYGIFSTEARAAVYAADAAIIVLDAVSGVEVQTERVWKFAAEFGRPVLFVVNRMDRERASFDRVGRVAPEEVRARRRRPSDPHRRGEGLPRHGRPRPDGGARQRRREAQRRPDPGRARGAGQGRARGARRGGRRGRGRPHGEVLRPGHPRGPGHRPGTEA